MNVVCKILRFHMDAAQSTWSRTEKNSGNNAELLVCIAERVAGWTELTKAAYVMLLTLFAIG